MLLAQEITVVVPADPWTIGTSIAAVAIALLSFGWTLSQGRTIRNIETREHEWQAVDRVSASVEVTHHQETHHLEVQGRNRMTTKSHWLRLRNSGRAPASNVSWSTTDDGPGFTLERTSLEVLHPGEHFDVYFALDQSVVPGWLFTTYWEDGNGEHVTERRISV